MGGDTFARAKIIRSDTDSVASACVYVCLDIVSKQREIEGKEILNVSVQHVQVGDTKTSMCLTQCDCQSDAQRPF